MKCFSKYLNFRAKNIPVFLKLSEFSRQNNVMIWSAFQIIWILAPKIFQVFLKISELSRQNNEMIWSAFQIIWIFAPKKYFKYLKCLSNYLNFRAKNISKYLKRCAQSMEKRDKKINGLSQIQRARSASWASSRLKRN